MDAQTALRELELYAYSTALKAFMAGPVDEWDKEEVLTKLRALWNIDNDAHMEVLRQLKSDTELQAIREGRALTSRPSRARPFKMGSLPAPSLAGAPSLQGPSGGLLSQPSLTRRASVRPGAPGLGSPGDLGAVRAASTRQRQRPRSSSLTGASDPRGYLGKRVWRLWPSESPPWVEGVVYDYDAEMDTYTILYDPNQDPESGLQETMESDYKFINPDDYVLCEKIDILTMPGSRRQWERPTLSSPPPPAPLLHPGLPSKKRKSMAAAQPVPQTAPFEPAWLAQRLQLAFEEELNEMLGVLERREQLLEAEITQLEAPGLTDEDLARRAELERRLVELSDKEFDLMVELRRLQQVEH